MLKIILLFCFIVSFTCMSFKERLKNKEFWEVLHLKALLDPVSTYNVFDGDSVCLSCPIDREMYLQLFDIATEAVGSMYNTFLSSNINRDPPNALNIIWSINNMKMLCNNNTKELLDLHSINARNVSKVEGKSEYACKNNELCLYNVKLGMPEKFVCTIGHKKLSVCLKIRG